MAAAVVRTWPHGAPRKGGVVLRAALPPTLLQSPRGSAAQSRAALLHFLSTFNGVTLFLPDLPCHVNLGKTPTCLGLKSHLHNEAACGSDKLGLGGAALGPKQMWQQ